MIPLNTALSFIQFTLLAILGVLSSFSDISKQKIKNTHLLSITYATCFLYISSFILWKAEWSTQLLSGAIGGTIGIICFITKMWKPGDAKLFTIYSLIMPGAEHYRAIIQPPLPCFPLFINSSLLGLIFLVPILIKEILAHRELIVKKIFSANKTQAILHSFITSLIISWIISPIIMVLAKGAFIFPLITYLLLPYTRILTSKTKPIIPIIIIGLILLIGFLLNQHVSPELLTPKKFLSFMLKAFIVSLLYEAANTTRSNTPDKEVRIPFAPFFFLGCLLTYIPSIIKVYGLIIPSGLRQ